MTEKTEEKIEAAEEQEEYICDDPVILDAFSDLKTAILAKRTDIVRQILSAAQSCKKKIHENLIKLLIELNFIA